MTTGIKTSWIAVTLLACITLLTSAAFADGHPDGPAAVYRGWGPSIPTADGYLCTLFDSFGAEVGSVQFHADGRIDVTLGSEVAHFQADPVGLTDLHPIDVASFPDVPKEFAKDGYQLMTFTGRFSIGVNTSEAKPVTSLAQRIGNVEVRCVYVVDRAGNVVFCLNCLFVVSE